MLKESGPEVYICILFVFYSALVAFGGQFLRVLEGLLPQMEAVGIARLVVFQRFWDGIHARYDLQ